ncbi:hypothetical protein [Candidatus Poriferisodalis sp.]|uniref:hypothetical protein n=1 Tax=Candidatus Poriferisodalis sp. TaxID=3101277 RepID=UPI003B01DDBE
MTSWAYDIGGLAACLTAAAMLRLSAEGFVAVLVVVAACHGWAQTSPQRMAAARRRLPWAVAAVFVVAIVRNAGDLSATELVGLTCLAGAVVGYLQVRVRKRRGKRSPTTSLTRQVRERPTQRSSAPSLRQRAQRRRHEYYEPDDFEDFEDDWDGDEWDDDPEYYGGPSGGRRRRAESWETGDADYI